VRIATEAAQSLYHVTRDALSHLCFGTACGSSVHPGAHGLLGMPWCSDGHCSPGRTTWQGGGRRLGEPETRRVFAQIIDTTATAGAGHGRQRQVAWPRCLACRVARTQKGPDRLYALSRARSSMPARLHAVTHFNQPRRACVRQRDASTPADPAQTLRRVRITASAWLCASRA